MPRLRRLALKDWLRVPERIISGDFPARLFLFTRQAKRDRGCRPLRLTQSTIPPELPRMLSRCLQQIGSRREWLQGCTDCSCRLLGLAAAQLELPMAFTLKT